MNYKQISHFRWNLCLQTHTKIGEQVDCILFYYMKIPHT